MKMKKEKYEIYDEVLADEPELPKNDKDEKANKEYEKAVKKFEKRIGKSIGWVEYERMGIFQVNDNDKICSSMLDEKSVWDVNLGESGGITCNCQEHATMLSYIAMIDARIKRMEKFFVKLSDGDKTA